MTATSLALAGSYSFELVASEPVSAVQSLATTIDVELVHPCVTTAVSATAIADQVLYAWMAQDASTLTATVAYTDFVCEVTENFGVDCGAFTYSVTPSVLEPNDPAVVMSATVDSTAELVELGLDSQLIASTGLVSTFGMTGVLVGYPGVSHQLDFGLKVYQFACISDQPSYEYQIGDGSVLEISYVLT